MSKESSAPIASRDFHGSAHFEPAYKIEAVKVSWQGLTNKWGFRWVAQVLRRNPAEVLWECQHGHFRKTDAVKCGYQHYYEEMFL